MNVSPARNNSSRRSIVLLASIASLAYFCFLCFYFSSHDAMWLDEFFAWNILSDHSLSHAIASWQHGADSGGILYYVVGWLLLQITGPYVFVMRFFSAIALWAASFLYWRLLSRSFSPLSALFGVSLIWCSHELVSRVAEVRFYGFYILMAVVATYATLIAVSRPLSRPKVFLICFCAHIGLISSHIMGVVYSGTILAALLVGKRSKATLTAACGIIFTWPLLLLFRSAIYYGSGNATSLIMPDLLDLTSYYHLPVSNKAGVLLSLGVIACLFMIFLRANARRILENTQQTNLLRVSFLFLLTPLAFFLISHLARPVFASRYMYPYWLGVATLGTLIFWAAEKKLPFRDRPTFRYGFIAAVAILIIVRHSEMVFREPLRRPIDAQPLTQAARIGGLPIISPDPDTFFQLAFYQPALQTYFLTNLDSELREHPNAPRGMMQSIEQQGYWADRIEDVNRFTHEHDNFLYLDFPQQQPFRQAFLRDTDWHTEAVGTIQIQSNPISIIKFERIRH